MSRSRLVLFVSIAIVAVGVIAGLGALWLQSARADVGPLPGEGLILPADTRFVMGFDVKRFTASPFYARFASQKTMKPEAMRDLEEKTGLDPTRDIDQIVVAGGQPAGAKTEALALVFGRFDLDKLGGTLETEGKAEARQHEGATLYTFTKESKPSTLALLDKRTILFGPTERVETAVTSRARGETPLEENAELIALVEKVKPGSTFWMVGDQTLLAGMPKGIPAPGMGGAEGAAASVNLPPLKSLTVTGDLDPQVSLALTGEAVDEASATKLADVVRGLVALVSLQAHQKPELQELASAISVTTEASRVHVSAQLPYELIDRLQEMQKKDKPAEKPAEEAEEEATTPTEEPEG